MVQEKLKRSSKQPKVVPAEHASGPSAPPTARHRPGAFVPREPEDQVAGSVLPAGTAVGQYSAMLANTADGEGLRAPGYGSGSYPAAGQVQYPGRQYSDEGLPYVHPAVTPPNPLATPHQHRPATSYMPAAHQQHQVSAAPTPVPGVRPYTAPGEVGEQRAPNCESAMPCILCV